MQVCLSHSFSLYVWVSWYVLWISTYCLIEAAVEFNKLCSAPRDLFQSFVISRVQIFAREANKRQFILKLLKNNFYRLTTVKSPGHLQDYYELVMTNAVDNHVEAVIPWDNPFGLKLHYDRLDVKNGFLTVIHMVPFTLSDESLFVWWGNGYQRVERHPDFSNGVKIS